MPQKAPGKSHREGISLKKLMQMFPDDDAARVWIEAQIWPDGPYCPRCGSTNVQHPIKHKTMTHRCRDCPNRARFSLKVGTVMEASNLGYRDWAIALYLLTTNLKSVSAMKLHRDLEIAYTSAWHLAHRLREAFASGEGRPFAGPVEADETYLGGKRKNMSNAKRKALREAGVGRGAVGKTAVVGVKDRATNKVAAQVVARTDALHLSGFVATKAKDGAKVYTDDAAAYNALDPFYQHDTVNHSASEYVRYEAGATIHTNGIEALWSMVKRSYVGTFHHFSEKHAPRYIGEFAGRHNMREMDTIDMMGTVAADMAGKRLKYRDLVA